MGDYKLAPVKPTPEMEAAGKYAMEAGCYVSGIYADMLAEVPAMQEEPVATAPVAAQQRFRHPQKTTRDWSAWQPASINLDRPSWEIDSQGYEVEYRLLYDASQPTEQTTFTVGTDLSDGKLTVVVMKHENGITWVIHSEVIQLAEQQPSPDVKRDDDYRTWYEETIVASNEAGFAGMSASQVIEYQDGEIMRLRVEREKLVEALEAAQKEAVYGINHARNGTQAAAALGRVSAICEAALAAHRKGGE